MFLKKLLVVFSLFCVLGVFFGCSKKPSTLENADKTTFVDVYEEIESHTDIEIKKVQSSSETKGTAKVLITYPDMMEIYEYLASEGVNFETISPRLLEQKINACLTDEDMYSNVKVEADVVQNGESWELASNDIVDSIIREQATLLLTHRINELVDSIEIESAPLYELGGE